MRGSPGGRRAHGDRDCSKRKDGEDEFAEMHGEYGVQPKDCDKLKITGRPFMPSGVVPINS
jgi:hypothetical protein